MIVKVHEVDWELNAVSALIVDGDRFPVLSRVKTKVEHPAGVEESVHVSIAQEVVYIL